MRFDEILTNDDVLDGLWDMHFDECTPIQEHSIPLIMEGRDLLACAQTGTGKTAAYLLPVINMLADGGYPDKDINCIVMAPTRELVQQIDRQLQGFAYFMPVSGMSVYGGTDGYTYDQQRRSLKNGADIVIATPGRLLAHLSMGYVDLSKVSFFILDEADRMLDMGFYDDIMQIASHLPKNHQTLLFSATMPPKIRQLAGKLLKNPEEIKLAVSKPADKIEQKAYVCYEPQKLPLLNKIFKDTPPERVIIFSGSKQKVKLLSRELRSVGYNIAEMHSDLTQTDRENVMLDFKSGKIKIVVATDIIARGIDIDDIEMVINYDVPHEPEDYVHRIGRTARANREGSAITFVAENEIYKFVRIEKLLEKEVPKGEIPSEFGASPEYKPTRGRSMSGNGRYRSRRYKSTPDHKRNSDNIKGVSNSRNEGNVNGDRDVNSVKKKRYYRHRSHNKSDAGKSE